MIGGPTGAKVAVRRVLGHLLLTIGNRVADGMVAGAMAFPVSTTVIALNLFPPP